MITRTTRIMGAIMALLVVVVIWQALAIANATEPVPVLNEPLQHILNTLPGVRGPALKVGADLRVQATKCNTTPGPIPVDASMTWGSIDPPGTAIQGGVGQVVRKPGCTEFLLTIPMPVAVDARTRGLVATIPGLTCVRWRIAGTEKPLNPLQIPGVWFSEPFQICP